MTNYKLAVTNKQPLTSSFLHLQYKGGSPLDDFWGYFYDDHHKNSRRFREKWRCTSSKKKSAETYWLKIWRSSAWRSTKSRSQSYFSSSARRSLFEHFFQLRMCRRELFWRSSQKSSSHGDSSNKAFYSWKISKIIDHDKENRMRLQIGTKRHTDRLTDW
jgi:hypothetical protein